MIRPAVFLAGGRAHMKLYQVKSEPLNVEYRIFRVSFSIRLAVFQASGGVHIQLFSQWFSICFKEASRFSKEKTSRDTTPVNLFNIRSTVDVRVSDSLSNAV